MGWLIDPETRSVLVYPPQQQPKLLEKETAILSSPVLVKDLSLTVGDLFGWLNESQNPDDTRGIFNSYKAY